MIRLVREGDLDYKKHMKVIASTGRVGNIADGTALRQLKNMLIVNITLFSRAAMDGGLPPETGYTLSDRYLQAVEKSNSMKSLAEINTAMQDDFIQRVHQYRQNKDLSKPIRICVEQLQSRMEEPITLEDLAKDFGYSTYYLSKKFKAETGQAFKDYLRSIRLQRAKFLLRSSELSILEISEKLQFCSASYFSDSFRKAYGISPSAYREQI
jgi:YesN/AraC family two-component response regulator